MTAFAASDLPPTVNTIERLIGWAVSAKRMIDGQKSNVEVEGGLPEKIVQMPSIERPDGTTCIIARLQLEIDPSYVNTKDKKFWEYIKESSQGSIPAAHKVA